MLDLFIAGWGTWCWHWVRKYLNEIEGNLANLGRTISTLWMNHLEFLKRPENRHQVGSMTSMRMKVLQQADVILCQTSSCRTAEMDNLFVRSDSKETQRSISCCIIDDACKCPESASLFPLGLGITKLVLVGDLIVNLDCAVTNSIVICFYIRFSYFFIN